MHPVRQFIEALWGPDFNDLKIFLCCFSPESKKSTFHTHIESFEEESLSRKKENVFSSVGGLLRPPNHGRGSTSDVVVIPGLWADLDVKKGAFGSKEKIIKFLEGLPLEPTLIVDSGGGIHPYWCFREPWWLDNEDRDLARRMLKGWLKYLEDAAGVNLDMVADLARVMRVPGTTNWKGEKPIEARVVRESDQRYNPSDFEVWTSADTWDPCIDPVEFTGARVDASKLVRGLTRNDSEFEKIWNKKKSHRDKTPSGVCMSLANYLVKGEILSDDQIMGVLAEWREANNAKPKPMTWYSRTIGKARASHRGASDANATLDELATDVARSEAAIEEAIESSEDPETIKKLEDESQEQRKRFLKTLEGYYGYEFQDIHVTQFLNEETGRIDGGEIHLSILGTRATLPVDCLFSQNTFRKAVFSTMLINLTALQKEQWSAVCTAILKIAGSKIVTADLQPGYSEVQLAHSFVNSSMVTENPSDTLTGTRVYIDEDGVKWFQLRDVVAYAKRNGDPVGKRRLAQALRDCGAFSKTFSVKNEELGIRSTTTLWTILAVN